MALAATATGLLISSSSHVASAAAATDGRAGPGRAPTNACLVSYVPEYKYPTDGYHLDARCDQLADFTKARGVSTYPYTPHNETEWFTQTGKTFHSGWKPKMPIVQPHEKVAMEYAPTGSGLNLYTGSGQTAQDQSATVQVTMPPDAKGLVALHYYDAGGWVLTLARGDVHDGIATLEIPAGKMPVGQHQVFATYNTAFPPYPTSMRTANTTFTVTPAATTAEQTSHS